jgi:hypothetical protein
MKNQRLVVLVKLVDNDDQKTFTIGQVNVKFHSMKHQQLINKYMIRVDNESISHSNVKLGLMSGLIEYT